jgi:hypothetical protein
VAQVRRAKSVAMVVDPIRNSVHYLSTNSLLNFQGVERYAEILVFGSKPGDRGRSLEETIKTLHFAYVSSENVVWILLSSHGTQRTPDLLL